MTGETRKGKRHKWILVVAVSLFALVTRSMVLPVAVARVHEFLNPPSFEQIQDQVRSGAVVSYRPLGGDFWIYYLGSRAWLEGVNPYVSRDMLQWSGLFTAHPNPSYAEMLKQNFTDIDDNRGYVATPVNLWILSPLTKLPFVVAYLAWAAFSIATYVTIVIVLTWKLTQDRSTMERVSDCLFGITFLVCLFGPVRQSLALGQIEAAYMGPMAAGIYLASFRGESTRGRLLAGASFGLATAIKIFPGILLFYFVINALADAVRAGGTLRERWRALVQSDASQILGAAFACLIATGLITFIVVPPSTIHSWFVKFWNFYIAV